MIYNIFLIFIICECGKSKISSTNSDECNRGMLEAESDFESGRIGYYFFGLPNPKFNTKLRLFSEKYQIKIKGGGDIITEQGNCYNDFMASKIEAKFGQGFFKKVEQEVDSIYLNGNGDCDLEYIGGKEALEKMIYCNLNTFDINSQSDFPSVFVKIIVNETGAIENIELVKKSEARLNTEALRVVRLLTNWKPAFTGGKPTRSQITLRIIFNPASKSICK